MPFLRGKRILLGVTGGIAAYKACDLVRRLREVGAEVQVTMTRGATEFIVPLTFQALSGRPVRTDLFDAEAEAGMGHIELARWADAIIVAPATADFIARLAQGRADDLLATLCLAADVPVCVAPAMNRAMWEDAATQDNRATLEARGCAIFGPASGGQACGETGEGRMLEPAELVECLAALFSTGSLSGRTVLVTAGPTREPIDPVRYLGNRSSGRMGFAVAAATREAGAHVILVSGPVALETPCGVERVDIETAQQMHDVVMARVAEADVFIGAAAVADYCPVAVATYKIKKLAERFMLDLERTPDILAEVAALECHPFVVGFAAETENLETNARDKLARKKLDLIAANDVSGGKGFDTDDNALEVFFRDGGRTSLPLQSKDKLARELVALIAEHMPSSTAQVALSAAKRNIKTMDRINGISQD